MSSQGNSNAVDFDPPSDEIQSVIPTDPTSMVSSLDSDVRSLCQKLLEKDRTIRDIEDRVFTLIAACKMAHYVANAVLEENVKLTQERDELVATMKKLGRDFSKGMLSQGNSNAVDFNPPDEILSVRPTDPTSLVSSLESDSPSLRQKLLEKDRIIRDLEDRVPALTAAGRMAHYVINTAIKENVKLTQERHELVATMKKLGRDFTKVKLSTGRDLLLATTENLGQMYSTLKLLKFRMELSRTLLMKYGDFSKLPETIDIGTCEQSVPKACPDKGTGKGFCFGGGSIQV